jgi:hypothetical protein
VGERKAMASSRGTVLRLLKSLKINNQLSQEGVYLPASNLVEAYKCAARARNVSDAVACHIMATHDAGDAAAAKAVIQVARLKEQIADVVYALRCVADGEWARI